MASNPKMADVVNPGDLEAERAAMKLELEWLLESQVPILIERLKIVLQDCLGKFGPKKEPENSAPSASTAVPAIPVTSSALTATVGTTSSISLFKKSDRTARTGFAPSPFRMNSVHDPAVHQLTGGFTFPSAPSPAAGIGNTVPASPLNGGGSAESAFVSTTLATLMAPSKMSNQASISSPLPAYASAGNLLTQPAPSKLLGWTFPLSGPNDALKGFITLSGNSVIKADLTIKFLRWNNGKPFQTSLSPSAPWILTQIQNSRNFIHMAVTELEEFGKNFGTDFTIEDVLNLLANLSTCLKRAMDSMMYTNANQKISEVMYVSKTVFYPALPHDLSIGFSVSYDRLLVSIHGLHVVAPPLPGAPTHKRERSGTIALSSMMGKTIVVEGQNFEITDHVEVDLQVPSLTEALAVMSACYEKAYRMLNKLGVFI